MSTRCNLIIEAGATFSLEVTWKDEGLVPVKLTGYMARMQLRRKATSEEADVSLDTEEGGLLINEEAGTVLVTMDADATAVLTGAYVYDLEIESPEGAVTRLIEGAAIVTPEVTRPTEEDNEEA